MSISRPNRLRTSWKRTGRIAAIASAVLLCSTFSDAQAPPRAIDETAVRAAIEQSLRSAPPGFELLQTPSQTGVQVLDVDVQHLSPARLRVTIDLSQKTLTYEPSGNVEILVDQILANLTRVTSGAGNVEYAFLVEGLPLDQFVARPPPARARPLALGSGGPVVVSAGHGWYRNEMASRWELQRDYYWGIVEDLVEVAYMDMRTPDNDALHDDRFKQIVAQAIYEGVQEWAGTPGTGIPDIDRRAQLSMTTRAAQDPRFGAAIGASYGVNVNWSAEWELRFMDFHVTGGRTVSMLHLAHWNDRTVCRVGFTDPDTGAWVGWDPVR